MGEYSPAKTGEYPRIQHPQFGYENMLGYLPLDISICSSKLTVFLELRSRETVCFWEQMSADKYPSIFSRQMKAIVYLYVYISHGYKQMVVTKISELFFVCHFFLVFVICVRQS